MKNLLINSSFIFFISFISAQNSFAQYSTEINETYSPIQTEENTNLNQDDLKMIKMLRILFKNLKIAICK